MTFIVLILAMLMYVSYTYLTLLPSDLVWFTVVVVSLIQIYYTPLPLRTLLTTSYYVTSLNYRTSQQDHDRSA